jgi:hypothetical protein
MSSTVIFVLCTGSTTNRSTRTNTLSKKENGAINQEHDISKLQLDSEGISRKHEKQTNIKKR